MHSNSQQQTKRHSSSAGIPLMSANPLHPMPLLDIPPSLLHYTSINPKHYQHANGNRGLSNTYRQQQRTVSNSHYHPYPLSQLLPLQRSYRSTQLLTRTPTALMGTSRGMSQYVSERNHSAQIRRNKEKLVRDDHISASSNITQVVVNDHNHPTTSSVKQTNNSSSSSSNNIPYKSLLTSDADDDNESKQYKDSSFDDIYYQCRYERYTAFSRTGLLNEVLSLCANIDRLQHEKSELEKRLRTEHKHICTAAQPSNNNNQEQSNIDTELNKTSDELQSQQDIQEIIIENNSSGNS